MNSGAVRDGSQIDFAAVLGIARSLGMYYARPWRGYALAKFYRRFLSPGDLAFDIGAHVGNRTRAMLRSGARVIAVEPQPILARFLRSTLPRKRVDMVEAAIGSEDGWTEIMVSRRHPTVSSGSRRFLDAVEGSSGFEQVRWDSTVKVRVLTLDSLIERFGMPKLVKIDVEGMEPDILAGLSRPVPVIAAEFVPAALPLAAECVDRISEVSAEYRFNVVMGEDTEFVADRWTDVSDAKDFVARQAQSGQSGDIYACLREAVPTDGLRA